MRHSVEKKPRIGLQQKRRPKEAPDENVAVKAVLGGQMTAQFQAGQRLYENLTFGSGDVGGVLPSGLQVALSEP